jgi:hypothetical protein
MMKENCKNWELLALDIDKGEGQGRLDELKI